MKLYDNSDVIATLIITNLYLYRIWAFGKAGIRNPESGIGTGMGTGSGTGTGTGTGNGNGNGTGTVM